MFCSKRQSQLSIERYKFPLHRRCRVHNICLTGLHLKFCSLLPFFKMWARSFLQSSSEAEVIVPRLREPNPFMRCRRKRKGRRERTLTERERERDEGITVNTANRGDRTTKQSLCRPELEFSSQIFCCSGKFGPISYWCTHRSTQKESIFNPCSAMITGGRKKTGITMIRLLVYKCHNNYTVFLQDCLSGLRFKSGLRLSV